MTKECASMVIPLHLCGGEAWLDEAERIIVTVKSDRYQRDFEGRDLAISGDCISVKLSQGLTGKFGPGRLDIELTIAYDNGCVLKSNTVHKTIQSAVRRDVA